MYCVIAPGDEMKTHHDELCLSTVVFRYYSTFMSRRVCALVSVMLILVASSLLVRTPHRKLPPALPAASMQQEPPLILWAWETPEDLAPLASQRAGVAFLAREVLLSHDFTVRPRYQPLRVAPGTWLIAVVRIETASSFTPTTDAARRCAFAIAEAAQLPNVRALQVDFDATAAQRDFYTTVLHDLRNDLPSGFPVSITALVSWCGIHSWLHTLPVDEVVPMFFRMGGPSAARATAPRSQSVIVEPLCSGSIGLSTDEAWPSVRPDQRVYLFHPGSWTKNDLVRVNRFGYEGSRGPDTP
jgi:hypothetical protein